MNKFQTEALRSLRSAGYAVTVWTPDELQGADPTRVEDRSVELGNEVIATLADPQFKPDDEPDEREVLVPPPGECVTQAAYLSVGGALCPFCGSGEINAEKLEMDGAQAWSTVTCSDCHKEWKDEYTLTGYSVVA